ncbi:MAG TPA: patatin-like phospholipase family protein [Myxococcales bacterium]|nr:patatin-like phospholipase family protein [Myxococcales bacterium]
MDSAPLALVLSGGGARGAYEVGVLRYVFGRLAPTLGERARPSIFCGTSVGAINACAVAANHDAPDFGTGVLVDRWRALRLDDVFRLGWGDLAGLARWIFGAARPNGPRSLLDAGPLAELVRSVIPWRNLHQGVADQRVIGVTVSATDVESGHTVVFVETEEKTIPRSRDRAIDWAAVRLTAQHALASAALPIIFPTVRVAGRMYSDGSLRQNTPISPALRLGAGRVLVIGLRTRSPAAARDGGRQDAEDQVAYSSPLFLFGKLMDALLLDRVENDLANLRQVNAALYELQKLAPMALGQEPLAAALETAGGGLRPVHDVFIRPSQDLGALAAQVLQEPSVRARLSGPAGYLLRRLGEAAGRGDPSDVLSYLLFDTEYESELISLGERDADARRDELERFLAEPETLPPRQMAP